MFVLLLASAAQARSPDSASAHAFAPSAAVAAGRGGNDNGNGHGHGNGHGNGNSGNADQGKGGNGGGRGNSPGIGPGAVTASASAASARAVANALAAAQRASAKLSAILERLFGRQPGASSTPTAAKLSTATPLAVIVGRAVATSNRSVPHAGATAADPVGPAWQPSPSTHSGEPRRGAEPLALPLAVAPPGDYVVTAVFGFLVLGLLWMLWIASLRPVFGRRPSRVPGTHRR